MKNLLKHSIVAMALGALATSASAIPLNTLIATNGSIAIGDKIFADFNLQNFNPGDIDVSATIAPGNIYLLNFSGSFVNLGNNAATDTVLFYTIRTASGLPLITEIDQSFTLTAQGTGGVVNIGESVHTGSFFGPVVAQSSVGFVFGVLDATDPAGEALQGDQLFVNPAQSKLWVTKDINLDASVNGSVGATLITQSFHQSTGVPDGGSTVILLGIALSGVCLIRRKLAA